MSSGGVADSWEDYIDSEDWQTQLSTLRTGENGQSGCEDEERELAVDGRRPEAPSDPQEPLVVRVQCESDRGLYTTAPDPAPRITILRRPDIGARHGSAPTDPQFASRNRQSAKSLQQRQVEYAEARQRILGNMGDEDAASQSDSSASSTQPAMEKQQVQLLRTTVSQPSLRSAVAIRSPHGPDGTPGFQLRR